MLYQSIILRKAFDWQLKTTARLLNEVFTCKYVFQRTFYGRVRFICQIRLWRWYSFLVWQGTAACVYDRLGHIEKRKIRPYRNKMHVTVHNGQSNREGVTKLFRQVVIYDSLISFYLSQKITFALGGQSLHSIFCHRNPILHIILWKNTNFELFKAYQSN